MKMILDGEIKQEVYEVLGVDYVILNTKKGHGKNVLNVENEKLFLKQNVANVMHCLLKITC